jgi:hypothetical protein
MTAFQRASTAGQFFICREVLGMSVECDEKNAINEAT